MNNIPGLRAERAAPPEPPVMTIESLYIAMQDMQQRHNQEKARYDEEKARSDEEKARSDEEKARSEEDIASLKKTVANLQANMTRFQPLVHNICRRSLLDMARLKILKLFPEYNNWSDLERNKSYDQIVIDIQVKLPDNPLRMNSVALRALIQQTMVDQYRLAGNDSAHPKDPHLLAPTIDTLGFGGRHIFIDTYQFIFGEAPNGFE